MTREEAYRLAMRACEETWNEKTCKQIKEALEQTRWIPVSERLPEEYGEYEITWTTSLALLNNQGFIGTAEYELTGEFDHENNRFKGEWLLDDSIKNYPDIKVTAWMPLPEPYKPQGRSGKK